MAVSIVTCLMMILSALISDVTSRMQMDYNSYSYYDQDYRALNSGIFQKRNNPRKYPTYEHYQDSNSGHTIYIGGNDNTYDHNRLSSGQESRSITGKESSYQGKPTKKVYVPVVIKKKKKKQKIITIQKGVYVPGGVQIFGKFKSLKSCMKACGAMGSCFAGDYNPWLGKCYTHSNVTACASMLTHKKITHFKKVLCTVTDAPRGLVVLGAHLVGGLLQKGINDLVTCSKKCATAGGGIAATTMRLNVITATANNHFLHSQVCFAIDYNFATHECYFHTNLFLRPGGVVNTGTYAGFPICPVLTGQVLAPNVDLAAHPSSVHMTFCPNDA